MMATGAVSANSSAPTPTSPFRMAQSNDQMPAVAVARVASLPIRPPSNSLQGSWQMTPREYGSSRPDSWHPAYMGSHGMRPAQYPMSEGISRWEQPMEQDNVDPYAQAYNMPRMMDPLNWQPAYENSEIPSVLVMRLREIVNLLPLTDRIFDPKGLDYEIVPVVQVPNSNIPDMVGERMGPYRAQRCDAGIHRVAIESPVLRIAYDPNRLYHFKIVEIDQSSRQVMGVVTLSLTQDGPDIPVSQNPLTPPEQIINRPEFRRSYMISGRDALNRGELVCSMLFDYSRPGECLWPMPEYGMNKMEPEALQSSETRSTSAEVMPLSRSFGKSVRQYPYRPVQSYPSPGLAARNMPYTPVREDNESVSDEVTSWWDLLSIELRSSLKGLFCSDLEVGDC